MVGIPAAGAALRLLILDDHALFREGLARLLVGEHGFEIAAVCGSIQEGLRELSARPVDVVLLDVDLGDERGSDFLSAARRAGFRGPILLVTAGLSDVGAARLLAEGASGIFFKEESATLLAESIRTVAAGRAWIDQRYLGALVAKDAEGPASDRRSLTAREKQVLRGVFEGLANKEIGARLGVSESAVKAVLQQLFDKTGVRTRSQLVRIALEQYRDAL